MASSPEARPQDATEAAPVAEKVEVAEETTTEPAAEKDTEEKSKPDEPQQRSDNKKDEEKEEKNDTGMAKDEPSIPADAAPVTTDGDGPTSPPPLPDEPLPDEEQGPTEDDDGWDPMWSDEHQAWYFVNRFTQQTQWENPRVPSASVSGAAAATAVTGYNPAIHGDYDPNAWYAKGEANPDEGVAATGGSGEDRIAAAAAAAAAIIQEGAGARYSHDAKASRQLNSFFDVAAANSAHDGRSLKAERSGIKPSKSELKAFKEKRRARKEEKRRAWLRD